MDVLSKIANDGNIQQMAAGSDVETIKKDSNSAVDNQNLTDSAEACLAKDMPTVAEASNDNDQPTSPATAEDQDVTVPTTEEEILSQEDIDQAIIP